MARQKRITVRGKQRVDIDPVVFLQVLLSIANSWEREDDAGLHSADVFDAAIEDNQEPTR